MDYQNIMQRHLGNISRGIGHDVSNRYSYIISQNDLTNAYLQMKNDLGYPLMMDSKYRRAIVYNKEGLEKEISKMIDGCILANIKELEKMIVEDISNDVETMLNGITQAQNGRVLMGKSNSKNASFTNIFAKSLAKGLVKGVGKMIDDIVNQ